MVSLLTAWPGGTALLYSSGKMLESSHSSPVREAAEGLECQFV